MGGSPGAALVPITHLEDPDSDKVIGEPSPEEIAPLAALAGARGRRQAGTL